MNPGGSRRGIEIKGHPLPNGEISPDYIAVSPDYFQTLRIPILKGQILTDRDTATAPGVMVVNAAMGGVLLLQEHHVDGLVIDFDNERGGHMLAVFHLPKSNGARCQEWLAHAGVQSGPVTFETQSARALSQVTK